MRSLAVALSLLTAGSVGFVAQRTTAPAPTDPAASAAASAVAPAAPAQALDDATIVAIFDQANTYDIDASQLALKKSKNADVRALATQFMNDHKAVRQQGRDLAKKLGVTPTPPKQNPLAPAHNKAMKELRGKSGAAFDKAYAANEVAFHQQVLDAVQTTLLPAIKNAQVKAFVEKVGPAFQGHLEAAKQLEKKLGGTS
jgi:putative membrane protein